MKYKQAFKCGHCGKENELTIDLVLQPKKKSTTLAQDHSLIRERFLR